MAPPFVKEEKQEKDRYYLNKGWKTSVCPEMFFVQGPGL
jgi:hypothetical protein